MTAPAETDVTTAEQLRTVLLYPAARGHATVVVDMARTWFCDSAGLTVLVRAHKRAVADGGELRLVIPARSAVARIFAITRLDLVIPLFGGLDEGPGPQARGRGRPSRPRPSAGRAVPGSPDSRAGGGELVTDDREIVSDRLAETIFGTRPNGRRSPCIPSGQKPRPGSLPGPDVGPFPASCGQS